MEALQIAQMLADLNDLQASQDQSASKALVSANKTLDTRPDQLQPPPTHHKRTLTEGRIMSSGGVGRMTDKFGRRIFSPPMTRTNSTGTPVTIPGTPRRDPGSTDTPDIDRASTLLSLYEIRAKLKEQDNSSLMKAREKINALAAKQQGQQQAKQQHSSPASAAAADQNRTMSTPPCAQRPEPISRMSFPRKP